MFFAFTCNAGGGHSRLPDSHLLFQIRSVYNAVRSVNAHLYSDLIFQSFSGQRAFYRLHTGFSQFLGELNDAGFITAIFSDSGLFLRAGIKTDDGYFFSSCAFNGIVGSQAA